MHMSVLYWFKSIYNIIYSYFQIAFKAGIMSCGDTRINYVLLTFNFISINFEYFYCTNNTGPR